MTKRGDTVTAHLAIEELEPISTEFFHSFGVAMAEWAGVERSLCRWFIAMTRMPEPLGRKIFYSSRNFNGRTDMVRAAIGFCTQPQNGRAIKVVEAGLSKAGGYSGFRNSMAHGEVILNMGPDGNYYSIVQGKDELLCPTKPIFNDELVVAAENFAKLKIALADSVPDDSKMPTHTLEQYLAQIQALPHSPNAKSDQSETVHRPQTEQDRLALRQKRASDILNRGPMVLMHSSRAR